MPRLTTKFCLFDRKKRTVPMDFRQLKTFRTVARLMSFRAAAQELHCTQSTVSAQIRNLEDDVGVKLFERLGRRIALTSEGEVLLPLAKKMLLMREEARHRVGATGDKSCSLTVRIPQSLASFHLPKVLEQYWGAFPYVQFSFANCAYSELEAEIHAGLTDIAFLLADSLPEKHLDTKLIGSQKLVYGLCKKHHLAGRKSLTVDDLKGERLFVPTHDCSYRMQLQKSIDDSSGYCSIIECSSMETLKRCVDLNLGIAVVPAGVAGDLDERCISVPSSDVFAEVGILRIWHKDKLVSEELAAFAEMFEEIL
ncbi:LysR family transcriptional regulator [Marinifilum sp. JC120]|nr:LysR family transcriptional regulator [Marinifilum sp. JC120]